MGSPARSRVVVVGMGMVGIAFAEKLIKYDKKQRFFELMIIGEEPHLAYNRVGLTSFFQHRNIKDLYLNPESWYEALPEGSMSYHLNTCATSIDTTAKAVHTSRGEPVHYDILVLATGSDALLPRHTPGHDAQGVFVYRTIKDLEDLIAFSAAKKDSDAIVVGGGLLGLEAAKAMMDLERYNSVKLIERNRWVLSRQLDQDAGGMVVEQVRDMGLDVKLSKRVAEITVDSSQSVTGVRFEDGETMDCSTICFAIGIRARDELARSAGIPCADNSSGIVVGDDLATSVPDVYAIGECASWEGQTFGLIAPGIEMAEVLAFNLTQAGAHSPRRFKSPDLSTKLKLMGVNVASFGDFFADRDGPKATTSMRTGSRGKVEQPVVKALTYRDPFLHTYKKYIFSDDGKQLIGGMMIGDTKDYVKLVAMVKSKKPLEADPGTLIIGSGSKEGDEADDLDDDTQICSCHNVSKGDVTSCIKDGTCTSIGEVKSCTKAGTGCAGCMPLVQSIFNKTMKSMGQEVKNNLCVHFDYSRGDLFNIIYVKGLQSLKEIMAHCGREADSTGCEVCKPAIGSILASLYNKHIMDKDRRGLQDTNDRFLANIQRNGTFSVVPRVYGGEITADKLVVIGNVAKEYGLYCKITGGQRIDMFGAKKQDLPAIWKKLVDGGLESGHAYAKSLRTVKSCVGSTWCRFGIGDSVGMAVRLEQRYKSVRGPHKFKGGVSGCVRECAEAQSKDFGLIATEKGYNIFVGGNGGAKPRHCDLLAKDVLPDDVIPILDRYLAWYIRTADKLQRTARWVENLPGGIQYLREVILDDKLGICADLEKQMQELISTYYCEWTEVLKSPERLKLFGQFANTEETVENVENVEEREQVRPTFWPKDSATVDFRGTKWSQLNWQPLAKCDQLMDSLAGSSIAVKRGDTQLAIFKVRGRYYCTQQMCPHKRAFVLSDGLIGDDHKTNKLWISCPYHKRNYELSGESAGKCMNDEEVNIATFPVEARQDGLIYVKLPPVDELDGVLGTEKWKLRAQDNEPRRDQKIAGPVRGRKIPSTAGSAIMVGGERGSSGLDW